MTVDNRDIEPIRSELIEAAVLAPSSHNTQPWLFQLVDDGVELLADRTRALPVNDPFDRELTISCGAALLNQRVAAAGLGLETTVHICPRSDSDLLARVQVRPGSNDESLARLRQAIPCRRTTREPFDDHRPPATAVHEFIEAARLEGAELRVVDNRRELAALVAEGDRHQFSDPRWRRELASWMHPRRTGDGLATPAIVAPISRLVVRHFDLGERIGSSDEALTCEAPFVAVLGTAGDTVADWLRAGQALERILLIAAGHGLQSGYLNQPCQVERLRSRLAEMYPGITPQLVIRIGRSAQPAKRAVRRPISAVLLEQPTQGTPADNR